MFLFSYYTLLDVLIKNTKQENLRTVYMLQSRRLRGYGLHDHRQRLEVPVVCRQRLLGVSIAMRCVYEATKDMSTPERTAYLNQRAEDVAKRYGFKIVNNVEEKSW